MMLEKSNYDVGLLTLKSPLDSKEIKPVNQKGNEPSIFKKTVIMATGPITSWQIDGEKQKQCQTLFFSVSKSLGMMTAAMELKDACSLEEKL